VSVIVPCYNEERFIGKALANLAEQYWLENYEIIVVDGMSDDRTRAVVEDFQQTHPDLSLRLLDNPERNIPRALNRGIAAARGEIIARMDAHAAPSSGYIRRCVEVLGEGNAAVVGMPCRVRPGADTLTARAIAIAVSHPFGIGDAKYRLGSDLEKSETQEDVDTVAFACFRKSLWSELNGFDEGLLTNEDYEFNYRTRARGGRVVLDRLDAGVPDLADCDGRAVGRRAWRRVLTEGNGLGLGRRDDGGACCAECECRSCCGGQSQSGHEASLLRARVHGPTVATVIRNW